MTEIKRRLLVEKCGELLHYTLVDIRMLTWDWTPGNEQWIELLSDITHNLPRFMIGRDDFGFDGVREQFIKLAEKRWPQSDPTSNRYVTLIDMDEKSFNEAYRQTSLAWPEPASVTADH